MRWSPHSWRAVAPEPVSAPASPGCDPLPWCDDPASLAVARVDLTCRAAHSLVGATPPTVLVGVDGAVHCAWHTPIEAPPPFSAHRPDHWLLPVGVPLTALAPAARSGRPSWALMTTLGTTPDHQLVLVDLEFWVLLGVEGNPDAERAVVAAVGAGLGVPPLSSPPTVFWGGVVPPREVGDDGHGEVLADAETALEALACTTIRPAVAVVAGDVPITAPASRSGRAVVATGRPSQGLWLAEGDALWRLQPQGLDVLPVGVGRIDLPE